MRPGSIGIGAASLLLAASIGASALASQAPEGNAAAAALVNVDVTACQACHGPGGISRNPRVPNLAGQQLDYLAAQLRAFKAGTRTNPLMQAVAAQLSDEQINALAQYWRSQPAAGAGAAAHGNTSAAPAIPSRMAFPADFPTGYTLYQTVTEDNVVTERYANEVVIAAARAGRPLPDGSVIIGVNRNGAGGPITSYAGMEARAGRGAAIPALLRNANWDFALFDAQRARNERLNQAPCLACHRPQEANSFVFTFPALRERAGGRAVN
jgi:cytochrome c553